MSTYTVDDLVEAARGANEEAEDKVEAPDEVWATCAALVFERAKRGTEKYGIPMPHILNLAVSVVDRVQAEVTAEKAEAERKARKAAEAEAQAAKKAEEAAKKAEQEAKKAEEAERKAREAAEERERAQGQRVTLLQGGLARVPDLHAFATRHLTYLGDQGSAPPDTLLAACLAEYTQAQQVLDDSVDFGSVSDSTEVGRKFSDYRRHPWDDVQVLGLCTPVLQVLGALVASSLPHSTVESLVSSLNLFRSFLALEGDLLAAGGGGTKVSEDRVLFPIAQLWVSDAVSTLTSDLGSTVYDARGAQTSVEVPIAERWRDSRNPVSYVGKTDLLVTVGGDPEYEGVTDGAHVRNSWLLVELKRPFDKLRKGGGGPKDQLLLEIAAYGIELAAERGDDDDVDDDTTPWRPMVGVLTDLFRINVGLGLLGPDWGTQQSEEENNETWRLGISTRTVDAREYVHAFLGAVTLAYWNEVDEGIRNVIGEREVWMERLLRPGGEATTIDLYPPSDTSSDSSGGGRGGEDGDGDRDGDDGKSEGTESETEHRLQPLRRSARLRGGQEGSGGGGRGAGPSNSAAVAAALGPKTFTRVPATRSALAELETDNVGEDGGGAWWKGLHGW